tara:strand:+ start:445 stop:678 length:234 start_codon:yes stop_codon:yes gene_type:complete
LSILSDLSLGLDKIQGFERPKTPWFGLELFVQSVSDVSQLGLGVTLQAIKAGAMCPFSPLERITGAVVALKYSTVSA